MNRTLPEQARDGGFYLEHHKPRNLLNTQPRARAHTFGRRQTCMALTDTTCYHADGTITSMHKHTRHATIVKGLPVTIRHKPLRATLSDYVHVAERAGLTPTTVAALYRQRRDNGYGYGTSEVAIETNATFRGGEH